MKTTLALIISLTLNLVYGQLSNAQFDIYAQRISTNSLKLEDIKKWVNTVENKQTYLTSFQLFEFHSKIGDYYKNKLDYSNALKHALLSLKFAKDTKSEFEVGTALYEKGYIEFEIGHFKESIKSINAAIDLFQKDNNDYWTTISLNILGNTYINLGEFETGLIYYKDALKRSNKLKNDMLRSLVLSNIGLYYLKENKADSALSFIEAGLKLEYGLSVPSKLSRSYGNIAYAYILKEEYEMASTYFDSSFSIATVNNQVIVLLNLHKDRALMHKNMGNYKLAIKDLEKTDSIQHWLDNKTEMESITAMKVALIENEKKKELEEEQLTSARIRHEKEVQAIRNYLLISCLIGLILIGLLIFWKFRSTNKKEKMLLSREKELTALSAELDRTQLEKQKLVNKQLNIELEDKNKDLTDFAIDIARKNEYLVKLMEHLKELQVSSQTQIPVKIQEVIAFTKHQQMIDRDLEEFQQNIEKVNHQFFQSLTTTFPNLTKTDLRLCALIRLGLTPKDISSLRGISSKSVEMGRYRLRKKMALPQDVDLFKFLLKIK